MTFGLMYNRNLGVRFCLPDSVSLAVVPLVKWGLWVWLLGDKKIPWASFFEASQGFVCWR